MNWRYVWTGVMFVGVGILFAGRGIGISSAPATGVVTVSASDSVIESATAADGRVGTGAAAKAEAALSREALDAEIARSDYVARANRGELHGADFERFRRLLRRDAELNRERTEALLQRLPTSRPRVEEL